MPGAQWQQRYPEARAYACPGLKEKEPSVFGGAEELRGGAAPAGWQGEVAPLWLSYEANPFNGKPFFNEVRTSRDWKFLPYVLLCPEPRCLPRNMPSQY